MDFDFALILVVLTFVSGLIWLYDKLVLAPVRARKLQEAKQQNNLQELPEAAVQEINKEPGWVDTGRSLFPVLFIVLVLRSFLVEPFQIPSGSMLPTLKVGDFILVNKFEYGFRLPVLNTKVIAMNTPQRGDVMVFKFPEDTRINFIKRVVGLPGDVIRYQNKKLYINGEQQPHILQPETPPGNPYGLSFVENLKGIDHYIYQDTRWPSQNNEWVVPEGHYFVLGDNRDNSRDSRAWGFVPDNLIVGKAFAVWMHWESFFSLPSFSNVRVIE
jgi:signal peptidase I